MYHKCIRIYICVYTYIFTYIYVCVHTLMMDIYTYLYILVHTYLYWYIHVGEVQEITLIQVTRPTYARYNRFT